MSQNQCTQKYFGINSYNAIFRCVDQSQPNWNNSFPYSRPSWGCPRLYSNSSPVNFNNADGFGLMTTLPFGACIVAIFASLAFFSQVVRLTEGKPKLIKFSCFIANGVEVYHAQRKLIYMLFVVMVFAATCGILYNGVIVQCANYNKSPGESTNTCNPYVGVPSLKTFGVFTGLSFLAASLIAALVIISSNHMATKATARNVFACVTSTKNGALVILKSGATIGLASSALSLLGLIICVMTLSVGTFDQRLFWQYLTGFGFGLSLASLFVRIGGGMFSKASSIGVELCDQLNVAPKFCINNPGVVLVKVGEIISEISGSALGMTESWIGAIIAAAILGFSEFSNLNLTEDEITCVFGSPDIAWWMLQSNFSIAAIAYPLWLAGIQLLCALYATLVMHYPIAVNQNVKQMQNRFTLILGLGVVTSCLLYAGLSAVASWICFGTSGEEWRLFGCALIGMMAGLLCSAFYSYNSFRSGAPSNHSDRVSFAMYDFISASGFANLFIAFLGICVLVGCNAIAGRYGVAIAALSVHAALSIHIALLSSYSISESALSMGQSCSDEINQDVYSRLLVLSRSVRPLVAGQKAIAVFAYSLTSYSLTFAFVQNTSSNGAQNINLDDPVILAGLLIGAVSPYIFVSLQLLPLRSMSEHVFLGIKSQIDNEPRLKDGNFVGDKNQQSDVAKLVKTTHFLSLMNLITPISVVLLLPIVAGFMLGSLALAGLLFGAIGTSTYMALSLGHLGSSSAHSMDNSLADMVSVVVSSFVSALAMWSLVMAPVFVMTNPSGSVFQTNSWWFGLLAGGVLALILIQRHVFHGLRNKRAKHELYTTVVGSMVSANIASNNNTMTVQ